jgi:SAM-dependent methyltransferase
MTTDDYALYDEEASATTDLVSMRREGGILLPILKAYRAELGEVVAELGPLYQPLVEPEWYEGRSVYVDFNAKALAFLRAKYGGSVTVVDYDINQISCERLDAVRAALAPSFDTMVFSQVLNYLRFRDVLAGCARLLRPNGLLFINNSFTSGHRDFFHPQRVLRAAHLHQVLEATGFEIVFSDHVVTRPDLMPPSLHAMYRVVARKKGGT